LIETLKAHAMNSGVKKWVLTKLPEPLIQWIKKHHYLRLLKRQGLDEEQDFAVIMRLVKRADHVLDVGANYGVYMKFLSDLVGNQGMVYSVEPIPSTFEILSFNARRLGLENVRILNYAFSDRTQDAVMEIPKLSTGGENYYMARINAGKTDPTLRQVPIKTTTLDRQFSAHGTRIAFIKCDVEGHELPCILGAIEVLRRWRPAWCVEVSGDPDLPKSDSWELLQVFERESYQPYWFDGRVLKKRQAGDVSVNYFFLQKHHLDSVKDLLAP
jgi:FkbM family methyltransferase